MEKTNAKQYPRRYFAKHMRCGVAGYEAEFIYVDDDCIKAMSPSFEGKPIYVNHQEVNLTNLQEEADGYVVKDFYNEKDGWHWAEIIVVSDKGQQAVNDGWMVSNAYMPTQSSEGGEHLGVPYNRKIVNAYYTHLAIVPNPRYEESVILSPEQFKDYQDKKASEIEELKNSKPTKGVNLMSLFGKVFKKERVEVTNSLPEDADLSTYEIEIEGKTLSLSEVINAVKMNAEKEEEKEEEKLNDDTEVCVGEEKMSLKELINKYNAIKKNDDGEDDVENEDEDEKERKEADDAKLEKKNSHFEELKNAHKTGGESEVVVVETMATKLARGKKLYSL